MALEEWLVGAQDYIRVGCFLLFFFGLAFLENIRPWRGWQSWRLRRWGRHFVLTVLSKILIRAIFATVLIEVAVNVQQKKQGILQNLDIPFALQVMLGVLILDFFIYMQHKFMHRFKWLWALHKVHHVDKEIDVSTGIRFHPLEEVISMGVKVLGVSFSGAPALAALIFEVLLNFGSLFTHANIKIPKPLEKKLRLVIVTPDMHRIHHSDNELDYNTNFGFSFSFWDRLFKTHRPTAFTGERHLTFGQELYRDPKYQSMYYMLMQPFNLRSQKPYRKKKRKLLMRVESE